MNKQQLAAATAVVMSDATLKGRLVDRFQITRPYANLGGLPGTYRTAPMCAVGGLAHAAGYDFDVLASVDAAGWTLYYEILGPLLRKVFGLSVEDLRRIYYANDNYDDLFMRRTAVVQALQAIYKADRA